MRPDGEGRRQRIVECGASGIIAVPPAPHGHIATEFEVSFLDPDILRCCTTACHRLLHKMYIDVNNSHLVRCKSFRRAARGRHISVL